MGGGDDVWQGEQGLADGTVFRVAFADEGVQSRSGDGSSAQASSRARSSTSPPRAALIRKAVGFIAARAAASIMNRVCGVRGACRVT